MPAAASWCYLWPYCIMYDGSQAQHTIMFHLPFAMSCRFFLSPFFPPSHPKFHNQINLFGWDLATRIDITPRLGRLSGANTDHVGMKYGETARELI